MLQRTEGLENIKYYIGKCDLSNEKKKLVKNNPHCVEYFCSYKNITDCTRCYNHLKKKINLQDSKKYKEELAKNNNSIKFCNKKCNDGYLYHILSNDSMRSDKFEIDQYKSMDLFKYNSLIYKYSEVPYVVNYENTYPKPKTVVHWGQLKMLLVTMLFFMKVINEDDKEVHVIYAGSATGDNILLLCKLFPNTRWYLADPNNHNLELYKKKDQVIEITKGYFTDELAEKYKIQFKNRDHKLLFMSDIREGTEDLKVLGNQESNIRWHKIIKPDYSYLKFRCGYETEKEYNYYKGDIYLQFYAPQSSTESRLLLEKDLVPYVYNIDEYQGKLYYFNRVIRPSYHKSVIDDNNLFDHCYDCVYFGYIIKNYISKFKVFNPYKNKDIFSIMVEITNILSEYSQNKIKSLNSYIKHNIL